MNFRKVPVTKTYIKKGETLTVEHFTFKRVETPNRQNKFNELNKVTTKRAKEDIEVNKEIEASYFFKE